MLIISSEEHKVSKLVVSVTEKPAVMSKVINNIKKLI